MRHLPRLHRFCSSVSTPLHHICAEQIWCKSIFSSSMHDDDEEHGDHRVEVVKKVTVFGTISENKITTEKVEFGFLPLYKINTKNISILSH